MLVLCRVVRLGFSFGLVVCFLLVCFLLFDFVGVCLVWVGTVVLWLFELCFWGLLFMVVEACCLVSRLMLDVLFVTGSILVGCILVGRLVGVRCVVLLFV